MSKLDLWTDGGCVPNPGTGGWAYLLENKQKGTRLQRSGRIENSTSNRAELTAVIKGLQALRNGPHDVTLHTDSEYVRLAVKGMRKPKINHDLLRLVTELCQMQRVTVEHISAHTGVENNELCDRLAMQAINA